MSGTQIDKRRRCQPILARRAAVAAAALPLLAALLLPPPAAAVTISPDLPPVSVRFNASGQVPSIVLTELPFTYAATVGGVAFTAVKTAPGCAPEQVHVSLGSADRKGRFSAVVSWAFCDAAVEAPGAAATVCAAGATPGSVTGPLVTKGLKPVVYYGTNPDPVAAGKRATGRPTSYASAHYAAPGRLAIKYASPGLAHVMLTGLEPGTKYYYTVVDNVASATQASATPRKLAKRDAGPTPFVGSFTTPGSTFPYNIAIIGDPGQTYNTTDTLLQLMTDWPGPAPRGSNWDDGGIDALVVVGDMPYADRADIASVRPPDCRYELAGNVYQPRWDAWFRLFQPLMAAVPTLSVTGNHEIEPVKAYWQPLASNFTNRQLAYNARMPRADGRRPDPEPATPKRPFANGYHAHALPGAALLVFITSYSASDVIASDPAGGFAPNSEQYKWLEATLKGVNRAETPWVFVMIHAGFYHTYAEHFKENECMRRAYEPLFLKYSVDVVFSGHVHAYERTKPMYDFKVDASGCAPAYVTIGDAGNIEGAAMQFISKDYKDRFMDCAAPTERSWPPYQPQTCYSYQSGAGSGCGAAGDGGPCYCFETQPAWSAYREPSFGHGRLIIESPTTASWRWLRNEDGAAKVSDSVTFTRDPSCPKSSAAAAAAG